MAILQSSDLSLKTLSHMYYCCLLSFFVVFVGFSDLVSEFGMLVVFMNYSSLLLEKRTLQKYKQLLRIQIVQRISSIYWKRLLEKNVNILYITMGNDSSVLQKYDITRFYRRQDWLRLGHRGNHELWKHIYTL